MWVYVLFIWGYPNLKGAFPHKTKYVCFDPLCKVTPYSGDYRDLYL